MLNMIAPYDKSQVFDTWNNLEVLFGDSHNGDIYDISLNPPKLICTSGPVLKKINSRSEIDEIIERTEPSYDGPVIRIFYYNDQWFFSTRRKIVADNLKWPFNAKNTFKELFAKYASLDKIDFYLDKNVSYSFLMLSKSVQNVLPNFKDELFLINTYDYQKELFNDQPANMRPPFAKTIINSSIYMAEEPRAQRGYLFYGKSGSVYQMDYRLFNRWEEVIQNRPWQMVFYELLKSQSIGEQMGDISLNEFCLFYEPAEQNFKRRLELINKIADVICEWNPQTAALMNGHPILMEILKTVTAKNKFDRPSHGFVVRQIAFMKYCLLDYLFRDMDEVFHYLDSSSFKSSPMNGEWEDVKRLD